MQNVKPYKVEYPLAGFEKPQVISTEDSTLLVPNSVYILLRRFSAKEDRRRLIAAPLLNNQINASQLGFENHLNFVYKKNGVLHPDEAFGLSALLNSAIVDRYFRIVNGNTQVNAAELRGMPLPPLDTIRQIGAKVRELASFDPNQVDSVVFSVLWQSKLLSEEFPMIQETRITMGKIEQAQEILELLGLPSAQQNEISALTLLALTQLSETSKWKDAACISLRVHDILVEIKQRYGREYAENTRETIRRQVLHQFEQAGLVLRNVDEPGRPTNSGLTNYTLSELALGCIREYGTSDWEIKREAFINQRGSLLELYEKAREQNKVPLRVADGTVDLLQKSMEHDSSQCCRWLQ
jgi:adenine-specific DNA-methyltransferase